MKILFVTSRNVVNTCGELRLIKNRALALYREYGIVTDYLVFRSRACLNKKREAMEGESTLTEFLFNLKNPFTYLSKKRALKAECYDRLASGAYDAVVLSGPFVFGMAKDIKKRFPDAKLIFDMHGAIEELVEYGAGGAKGVVKTVLYKLLKRSEKKAVVYADGIMAVSHALKNYLGGQYGVTDKRYFIIPCAIGKTTLSADKIEDNRAVYRQKYGVKDDEILFVYSGGLSAWQCTDRSVALFKEIRQELPNAKMLFLTGNTEVVKQKYSSDGIIVDSAPVELVNDVLCAGDYAFMLREKSFTNEVAYPNKFIEYVSSGMKVVATENVVDVADQIRKFGVGVILREDYGAELMEFVKTGYDRLADLEGRNALIDDVCFENRIKALVEFLGE